MKRFVLFLTLVIILFTSACSANSTKAPEEKFNDYIKAWEKQDFKKMYTMISSKAEKQYKLEEFIDRYQKIYKDLQISDPKITFEELEKSTLKKAKKNGEITIPFEVKLKSIAGPISFKYEATLVQEEFEKDKKTKKDWFVQWDPGFIFPDMKDGSKIKMEIIEPTRGEILDRNKMPLAMNGLVYEIGIIPERFDENETQSKERLADLLNISVEFIDEQLQQDWVQSDYFVPIQKIDSENEAIVNEAMTIEGVTKRDAAGRIYPAGKSAAHLTGYISQVTAEDLKKLDKDRYLPEDMVGKSGLEKLFEDKLKGERGAKIYIQKENEEIILAEKPVKHGENITTTIDINIQEKIFESYQGVAGTAAAINPKTGETLALISSPAYDPNNMVLGISQERWDVLQDDPNKPFLNRFSATYAPGSVLKPITAAIGLKNGSLKAEEGLEINGATWSNGKGWGDYKVRRVSVTGAPVDLTDALVRSDNIYFAMQAVRMGKDAYTKGLKQFGIGEEFPYKYPITHSSISSTGKIEDEVLLANTSYGQGEIELSSLHLATAYSPILNDGDMIKPTLLLSEKTGQIWKKNLLSKEDAEVIQEGLRKVVTKGTAKAAKNDQVAISGKTGTAELKLSADQRGDENSWFVAYPTETKDFIIALMMEKTQRLEGGIATKTATEIIQYVKK